MVRAAFTLFEARSINFAIVVYSLSLHVEMFDLHFNQLWDPGGQDG